MAQRREDFPSLVERFMAYVQIDTQADAASNTRPSTAGQHDLLDLLVRELEALGLADVEKTDYAAVMATLPANLPDDHPRPAEVPVIGFIAHVDTYQGTKGSRVRPSVFRNYDGSRIVLKEGGGARSRGRSRPPAARRGRPRPHRRNHPAGCRRQGRGGRNHARPDAAHHGPLDPSWPCPGGLYRGRGNRPGRRPFRHRALRRRFRLHHGRQRSG